MRHGTLLALVLLIGCDTPIPTDTTDPAWSADAPDVPMPPPAVFTLTSDLREAYSGITVRLTATLPAQAPDGVRVFFVASDGTGAPVCPGPLTPDCLDTTGAFELAGSASTVDDVAVLDWQVPAVWGSDRLQIQAVVRTGSANYFSNTLEIDRTRPGYDLNGDGLSEVVIAAPGQTVAGASASGRLHVLRGTTGPLRFTGTYLTEDQTTQTFGTGPESGDYFGGIHASGDFDGDGYDDLLLGWPLENNGALIEAGWLGMQEGGPVPGSVEWWDGDDAAFGGLAEAGDQLGAALAVGDFDRDGYDDAVIGMPGDTVSGHVKSGSVRVFYGSTFGFGGGGVLPITQDVLPGFITEANDAYGSALATGDLNGDGYDDLAIGAPRESTGVRITNGAVAVIFGSASGLDLSTAMQLDAEALGHPQFSATNFGTALAMGDFDGDGLDELAIGAPNEDVDGVVDAGAVFIAAWDGASFSGPRLIEGTIGSDWLVPQENDRLGSVLAAADLERDGYDDLLTGVPLKDNNVLYATDSGIVDITWGGPDFLTTRTGTHTVSFLIGGGDTYTNGWFGASLTVVDIDGNFIPDVIIGVPGEPCAEGLPSGGRVGVLRNFESSESLYHGASPMLSETCESGDLMGDTFPYFSIRGG